MMDLGAEVRRLVESLTPDLDDPAIDLAARLEHLGSRGVPPGAQRDFSSLCRRLLLLDRDRYGAASAKEWGLRLSSRLVGTSVARGGAHVAARNVELGLKHLQSGLRREDTDASQRRFGLWALASASIQQRNLEAARDFTHQWIAVAQDEEALRALLLGHLLDLLSGEGEPARGLEQLEPHVTPAWRPAWLLLSAWAGPGQELAGWSEPSAERTCAGELRGRSTGESPARASPPLVLGADWCVPLDAEQALERRDLAGLCALRRRFAAPDAIEQVDRLERLARRLAAWDLRRPLDEVLRVLEQREPETFHRFILDRQLGKHVTRDLLGPDSSSGAALPREDVVILMTDVRGYSKIVADTPPERVHGLLGPVFKALHEELESVDGMILEFQGDSIMVVFNAFADQRTRDVDILSSVTRALRRVQLLAALQQLRSEPGLELGVGLHKGPVAKGYLGGLARCHLAILGNTVNVAARLEDLTRRIDQPIAVSASLVGGDPRLPSFWEEPERVQFALRDLGDRRDLKNVAAQRVFGLTPLVRHWVDFVPMGFVAEPEPGVVYLDTGCALRPGIIDIHVGGQDGRSTCALVLQYPAYVRDMVVSTGQASPQVEFRLHESPDLDCVAALYAAYELTDGDPYDPPRWAALRRLTEYVTEVNRGSVPDLTGFQDSLYGVFIAHVNLAARSARDAGHTFSNHDWLTAGLRVVDAALFLAERDGAEAQLSRIFAAAPDWFPAERALLREDREVRYAEDKQRGLEYAARVGGHPDPVTGLWLDHPRSLLFKEWARADGYVFLAVDWSAADKSRFVISVHPDSGFQLSGLGRDLEEQETRARGDDQRRPTEPRRYPADNSDPWYFGQGHGWTIVDAPSCGTVLNAEQVREIHQSWEPGANPRRLED